MFIAQPFAAPTCHAMGNVQALRFPNDFDPPSTSTPKKAQTATEVEVKISVKFPSVTKHRVLEDDFAKIGKALLRGDYGSIAKVVTTSSILRKEVLERLLKLLTKEIDNLCSTKNPSLLRGTTKEKLLTFKLEKLCDEWELRAPLFSSFLRACCLKSDQSVGETKWYPAMVIAGSVLLKQRNKHMNALASILGITVKTKAIEV